nr:heparinase II/III family protein [uncultured Shinella sp.]
MTVHDEASSDLLSSSDIYLQRAFMSPESQRIEGFRPRGDVKPWPLNFPIDWSSDPFQDVNWCFQLNAWRMTETLLSEYQVTRDKALLREAVAYIYDWREFHVVQRRPNPMAWYDMAVGIRAMRLAFLWQLHQAGELDLTEGEKEWFAELVSLHLLELRNENISINNHGIFQVAGVGVLWAVGLATEAHRTAASVKFREIMASQFTDEWAHTENSPAYHWFVANLMSSLTSLRFLDPEYKKHLFSILRAAEWLVFPDGLTAPIGASAGRQKTLRPQPGTRVRDRSKSGYVIVRSPESMLFVTGMAHNLIHKHADDLSFHLFEDGRHVFIDSGKYGFKKDRYRAYFQSAAAHNTISLADKVVMPSTIELAGSLITSVARDGETYIIKGRLRRPDLFDQEREISSRLGHSLNITDRVTSHSEQAFVSSLHLAPSLVPIPQPGGFAIDLGDKLVRVCAEATAPFSIEFRKGEKDPILGWNSPRYLQIEEIWVARILLKAEQATLSWRVTFEDKIARPNPTARQRSSRHWRLPCRLLFGQ